MRYYWYIHKYRFIRRHIFQMKADISKYTVLRLIKIKTHMQNFPVTKQTTHQGGFGPSPAARKKPQLHRAELSSRFSQRYERFVSQNSNCFELKFRAAQILNMFASFPTCFIYLTTLDNWPCSCDATNGKSLLHQMGRGP